LLPYLVTLQLVTLISAVMLRQALTIPMAVLIQQAVKAHIKYAVLAQEQINIALPTMIMAI
jgi:hypothetical protein